MTHHVALLPHGMHRVSSMFSVLHDTIEVFVHYFTQFELRVLRALAMYLHKPVSKVGFYKSRQLLLKVLRCQHAKAGDKMGSLANKKNINLSIASSTWRMERKRINEERQSLNLLLLTTWQQLMPIPTMLVASSKVFFIPSYPLPTSHCGCPKK